MMGGSLGKEKTKRRIKGSLGTFWDTHCSPKNETTLHPEASRSEVIEHNNSCSPPPYEASANEGDLLSVPRIDKITERVYYKDGKTAIIETMDVLPGRFFRVWGRFCSNRLFFTDSPSLLSRVIH
eukprot:Nk52_evm1s2654 gene=Nk52_evmTU1s2654